MSINKEQQYTALYGPFAPGKYFPGDHLNTNGLNSIVVWSYQATDGRGLVYVCDDNGGWPHEVPESATIAATDDVSSSSDGEQSSVPFAIVDGLYQIRDQAGNTATLTIEQAGALLEWLYQQRDDFFKQMCGAQ